MFPWNQNRSTVCSRCPSSCSAAFSPSSPSRRSQSAEKCHFFLSSWLSWEGLNWTISFWPFSFRALIHSAQSISGVFQLVEHWTLLSNHFYFYILSVSFKTELFNIFTLALLFDAEEIFSKLIDFKFTNFPVSCTVVAKTFVHLWFD